MSRALAIAAFSVALLVSPAARADSVQLQLGGTWMGNLHNELRIPAFDVQAGWRRDLSWSAVDVGAEALGFFTARGVDPALGLRVGWTVPFDVGPVRVRPGVSVGAYWTRVSPVLPIGYVDVAVERALGAWTVGGALSGAYSLFGAGVQPRLVVGRSL